MAAPKRIGLVLDIKVDNQTAKQLARVESELLGVNNQLRAAKKAGDTDVYGKLKVQQQGLRQEANKLRTAIRGQVKEFESAKFPKDSLIGLRGEYRKLRVEIDKLSDVERKSASGKRLISKARQTKKEIDRLGASVRDFRSNVGNYTSALGGITRGLNSFALAAGVGLGIQELVQGVGRSIGVFADFKDQLALLGVVSKATDAELKLLEQDALRLGETTQFTSSEVAKLQTEFAKAGFSTQEILAATEATLNLATATGEGLAESSQVVAATLGGYRLDVDETRRVTDVMAASFNSSRLDLEKFRESMKLVAPIAANAGVSLEQTTATLGALTDAGLEGSLAGTGLRLILSDLSTGSSKLSKELGIVVKDGETFKVALDRLSKSGIDNSKAFDLVGRRAQSALTIIANDTDKIAELTKNFEGASEGIGETAAAAQKAQDTLQGDFRKFNSALEGFQLRIVGIFDGVLRGAVQLGTSLFKPIENGIRVLLRILKPLFDAFGDLFRELGLGEEISLGFGRILQFLGSTLVLVVNVITTAVTGFTQLVGIIRRVVNESPLLTTVFQSIGGAIGFVQDAVLNLPALFNGLVQSFRQLRDNIVNLDFSTSIVDAFKKGFNDAKDLGAKKAIEKEGEDAEQTAKKAGAKTGNAFADELSTAFEKGTNNRIKRQVDKLADGSIQFLRKQLADLNKELNNELTEESAIVEQIEKITTKEKELKDLEDTINGVRAALTREFISPVAPLNAPTPTATANTDTEGANANRLAETLANIERIKQERIKAANESADSEEKIEERKRAINLEAERAAIQARLDFEKLSYTERLGLENELFEKKKSLNEKEIEEERKKQEGIKQLAKAAYEQIFKFALQGIENEKNALQERTEQQIADIETEYEARILAAEGNAEEQARLRKEQGAKEKQVEKDAARQRKQIAKKEALIQGALAVIKAAPNPLLMAFAALTTAINVGQIEAQNFAAGGKVNVRTEDGANRVLPANVPRQRSGRVIGRNIQPTPGGDNKIVALTDGEAVLNKQQIRTGELQYGKNFLKNIGVPGFAAGGIIGETPQITNPRNAIQQSLARQTVELRAMISDDSIRRMAQEVAERTAEAIKTGSKEGIKEANLDNIRENRARENQVA